MLKTKKLVLSLPFLLPSILGGCNNESVAYELTNFESEITEYPDILQLELQYEVTNNADEDYYLTFTFPSYIQEALTDPVSVMPIEAGSVGSGAMNVSVSKAGGQMTEETINAILDGELPYVEKVVIGKAVDME